MCEFIGFWDNEIKVRLRDDVIATEYGHTFAVLQVLGDLAPAWRGLVNDVIMCQTGDVQDLDQCCPLLVLAAYLVPFCLTQASVLSFGQEAILEEFYHQGPYFLPLLLEVVMGILHKVGLLLKPFLLLTQNSLLYVAIQVLIILLGFLKFLLI